MTAASELSRTRVALPSLSTMVSELQRIAFAPADPPPLRILGRPRGLVV